MVRRVVWYGMAAVFPAAFVAAGVGPLSVRNIRLHGWGQSHASHVFVGCCRGCGGRSVAMALIDIVVNGRYLVSPPTNV
jgi:hypothetical protein